jgi:sec-independent protein translocase protein TatC
LTEKESGAIRPVLFGGIFFFVAGAAFCYYVVFPRTIEFLVWFDVNLGFKPSYTPTEYYGMLTTFMLIFGACFELPLVSAIFARLGLLKPQWLLIFWRYIIVGCFVAGAFLSPGADPISMLIMSFSLVFLYGLSILLAIICYRKHQQAKAEQSSS